MTHVPQFSRIAEPAILSANTYNWTPSGAASHRRSNEAKRIAEVTDYFKALGFSVCEDEQSCWGERQYSGKTVSFYFMYRESTSNVYKKLSVNIGKKRSNITTIRKIHADVDGLKWIEYSLARLEQSAGINYDPTTEFEVLREKYGHLITPDHEARIAKIFEKCRL